MDVKQWIMEHWSDILAWIWAFVSYFLYLVNVLKVGKTRRLLSVQFKERTDNVNTVNAALEKRVAARCDEVNRLGDALLTESKELSDYAKKIVEEERARTEAAIAEMRTYYEAEIQKYRQSLIEISQADTALVAKGVAETIAQRFAEEKPAASVDATGVKTEMQEGTENAHV